MIRLAMLLGSMLLSFSLFAAIDTHQFETPAQEQQYRELTQSLRCPKCQNNNIADSNAMIAADMRQKVYQLTLQGQTRQQITDYMVARYGDFVTYKPPVRASTLILWLGPILFVLAGGIIIVTRSRKRRQQDEVLSEAEQKRLRELLKNSGKEE